MVFSLYMKNTGTLFTLKHNSCSEINYMTNRLNNFTTCMYHFKNYFHAVTASKLNQLTVKHHRDNSVNFYGTL